MIEQSDSLTTRRAVIAGAGALGVAGALAACGGDETPSTSGTNNTQPTGGASPTTGAAAGDVLAKKTDVPVGGGKIVGAAGLVVTQPAAGEFKAFSAIYTHQGCLVSSVDNGTINCRCHQSMFDIKDGSVKGGPATAPLPAKAVKVEGDDIKLA